MKPWELWRCYCTRGQVPAVLFGFAAWWKALCTWTVTREPRACDSGTKGPREYWWEAPNRGSTDRKHRAEGVSVASREASAGIPELRGTLEFKGLLGMLGKGGLKGLYIQST